MTEHPNRLDLLFDSLRTYTMIPRDRFIENVRYAEWLKREADFPDGCIIECGVWKGGMCAAFLEIFGHDRSYILFDSFEGLPLPSERDGEDARWWREHPEHPRFFNNCSASRSELHPSLGKSCSGPDIKVVDGWFCETLGKVSLPPVAFLHLDCDWYDSYACCLDRIWDKVLPGGAIIVDDYFDWEGSRKAVHDFLSKVGAREPIERIGSTGGALIRRRGPWALSESPHLR